MCDGAHTGVRRRTKNVVIGRRDVALNHRELITVYHYQYWDGDNIQLLTSKWEATLECIRSGLGNPIIESGRQVPASEVDAFGRHFATD
jgi:hypothetical protein